MTSDEARKREVELLNRRQEWMAENVIKPFVDKLVEQQILPPVKDVKVDFGNNQ